MFESLTVEAGSLGQCREAFRLSADNTMKNTSSDVGFLVCIVLGYLCFPKSYGSVPVVPDTEQDADENRHDKEQRDEPDKDHQRMPRHVVQ